MEFRNTYHQFQNKKRRVFEKKIKITKRQIHLQNSKSESNIPDVTTATEMLCAHQVPLCSLAEEIQGAKYDFNIFGLFLPPYNCTSIVYVAVHSR